MNSNSTRQRRLLATLVFGARFSARRPALPRRRLLRRLTCVYFVKVFAYVRENPSLNSKILKSKGAFARVTGPCRYSNGFVAVYTSAASDGIGWIDRSNVF